MGSLAALNHSWHFGNRDVACQANRKHNEVHPDNAVDLDFDLKQQFIADRFMIGVISEAFIILRVKSDSACVDNK